MNPFDISAKKLFEELESDSAFAINNYPQFELLQENNIPNYDSYGNADYSVSFIIKNKSDNKLYKLYGIYQSYNGLEYQGIKEVQEQTKTITIYEEVNS